MNVLVVAKKIREDETMRFGSALRPGLVIRGG